MEGWGINPGGRGFKSHARTLAAGVLFSILTPQADADARPPEALKPSVAIDRPLVLEGDPRPVYVLVRLEAASEDASETPRPPLNLSLVLDRSGSMADAGKLDYLKRAAARIIGQLSPKDVLSIVEYDDRITVLWPAGPVTAPRLIGELVEGLTPRGSTDLAGGMMAGVAEADRAHDRHIAKGDALTRVILLSDGLANRGVTAPAAIEALARTAKADGVPVTTLGLGRDYDEDLMEAIAETGGGRYYYIENPDQIDRIFAQEMNALFHVSARDVTLRIDPAGPSKDAQILGFEGLTVALGDLAAGETRALLVRLPVDTQSRGMKDLGQLNVSYVDAVSRRRQTFSANLGVEVSDDGGAVQRAENHDVAVEAVLAETERHQKEAVKRLQTGDAAYAQRQMDELIARTQSRQAELKDKRLERKLEALSVERADMAQAAAAPATSAAYLKRTKQRLYQAKLGSRKLSVLKEGDSGYEVERLQEALTKMGYYQGPVDGIYGASVTQAVKAFQKAENMGPDGIAGPSTMKELGLY